MTARRSALAVLVGALVATFLVVGSSLGPVARPDVVRFDGVELQIDYLNGSPPTFGPPSQNACNETFPVGSSSPPPAPECPEELFGGSSYDLWFFEAGNPGGSPGLWANMTVAGPFFFQVNPGLSGDTPTIYSSANGTFVGGDHFLYGLGEWSGWALVFTLPTSLSPPAGGLWFDATLTIQPTNETTVPSP